jgi:hypothetical protein
VTTAGPTPAAPAKAAREVDAHGHRQVIVRSFPKTIFLYPLGLTALACGILAATGLVGAQALGFVFATIFFFNLVVVSFEFKRGAPVVLLLLALVAVLAGVLLNQRYNLVGFLGAVYAHLELAANAAFYFAIAGGYGVVLVGVLAAARFDYWEVRPNELIHHQGLLHDSERLPASQITIKKEIPDIFEYILLGSGTLTIFPSGRDKAVVLENVPRINAVEDDIEELLEALEVKVEKPA